MPSSDEITKGLRKSVPTKYAATRSADGPGARMPSKRAMALLTNRYLPFIGVDPAQQGKGSGAALLKSVLAKCDKTHVPAYLESTNPRNRTLYERLAFELWAKLRWAIVHPLSRCCDAHFNHNLRNADIVRRGRHVRLRPPKRMN